MSQPPEPHDSANASGTPSAWDEDFPLDLFDALDTDAGASTVEEVALQRRNELRDWMLDRLLGTLEEIPLERSSEARAIIEQQAQELYRQSRISLSAAEQRQLFEEIEDELLGFGPLEPLLRDPTISEIMVNGPKTVFVEQQGSRREVAVAFRDDDHLMRVIEHIVRPLGRHLDRRTPIVDARLEDGTRVNAVFPPIALDGPTITIRRPVRERFELAELVGLGTLSEQMAEFLRACVLARLNVVVSGGAGSGKTTLLNALARFIPGDERVITIEEPAELQLQRRHLVRLEASSDEAEGGTGATMYDLVGNALRMRAERLVVGECRAAEALALIQAMNTGYDGSLTSVHANSPRDCLARLELMCLMAGTALPLGVIREQVAAAVDLIVQQTRLRDGTRKVVAITEVEGMEGDRIVTQDLSTISEEGVDDNGSVVGAFHARGIAPLFLPRLEATGYRPPSEMFVADRERPLY
ncbi:MAG TPA: CpaF family protein [Ardenticatenaceae bacterium]|nr:CpaF family protein [Ardenticatenaceae bacterium]